MIQISGAFEYPGGVPASLATDSREQWDFPNGFPPLIHMIIEGLRKSQNAAMQNQAYRLARKWVMSNYRVYKETKKMWEKYDVSGSYPHPGIGGEYEVQDGFGWTNGVILDLLTKYKDEMKIVDYTQLQHSPFRPHDENAALRRFRRLANY
ncbi:unnamed protein product [Thelazia callipaeda]|uniref:Trehalase n=1 Tax=Thelazia callipaeda TaxID=103827 RepID=A0A3P7KH88_THECL|nr:unnamed protein product [Thelazia callipaeda]